MEARMQWKYGQRGIRRLVTTTHGALSSRRAREVPLCEAATEPRCRRPPESAKRLPSRVADAHRNCSEAATQRCCEAGAKRRYGGLRRAAFFGASDETLQLDDGSLVPRIH